MKNKILITGGAGYIGSHLAQKFIKEGQELIILDNFINSKKDVSRFNNKNIKVIEGDLINRDFVSNVFKTNQIDFVIHLAALISVPDSFSNPSLYFENNVKGGINLLECMAENNVKKIIYSSTCAIYGEPQYLPVDEAHTINPNNPYGESKYMLEKILIWYSQIFEIKYVIFRFFNVIGCDPKIGDPRLNNHTLLYNLVSSGLNKSKFFKTFVKCNTPDGTPIRDFIDVLDLSNAHFLAYNYINSSKANRVINLGNERGISVQNLINATEKIIGEKISIANGQIREKDTQNIYANSALARSVLGWEPKTSLEQSIENFVLWYKNTKRNE